MNLFRATAKRRAAFFTNSSTEKIKETVRIKTAYRWHPVDDVEEAGRAAAISKMAAILLWVIPPTRPCQQSTGNLAPAPGPQYRIEAFDQQRLFRRQSVPVPRQAGLPVAVRDIQTYSHQQWCLEGHELPSYTPRRLLPPELV